MRACIGAALAAFALAGCAYQAPVTAAPNLNVYSSYGEKLPGRYALYISSDTFNTVAKPTGFNCQAHSFPLDLREAFKASTITTVRQLVEEVEVVDRPQPLADLQRKGLRGQISVSADALVARLQVIPGFWSATADSTVELTAGLTVDADGGRALGTSAQGFGNAQSGAGAFCGDASHALADATEKAMRQLLGQLGERLSNSERLRHAAASVSPAAIERVSETAADPAKSAPVSKQCGMVPQPNGAVRFVPCR